MRNNAHQHNYLIDDQALLHNERKTTNVVILTAAMMVVEIIAGFLTSSMSLLADGWHMASHAGALGIALIAYRLAKSPQMAKRFSFGTGKLIPLGGYTSAVVLALIALGMMYESSLRLMHPVAIKFDEAIVVAIVGLVVNIVSVLILDSGSHHHNHNHHSHNHDHGHNHKHTHGDHHHHHHDHNLRAAYFHAIADAFTSILAIAALVIGKIFNIVWVDALMGIVGSLVILKWSAGLCRETAWELLDGHARHIDLERIRARLESENTTVSDLHIWRIAPKAHACEVILHTAQIRGIDFYRQILAHEFDLQHIVIEEHTA